MASAYILKGIGTAVTYNSPGFPVITGLLDVPELIEHPELLALEASPNAGLSSFAGFVQGDTIKIALIPMGFIALACAIRHYKLENHTLDIGDGGGAANLFSNRSCNSATAVALSSVLAAAKIYTSDDYILVTFDQAVTFTTAAFVVSIVGALAE
jgi:hypothetical protein